MAHQEIEAVEVTDVSSAANALSQIDGIFEEEEEQETVETKEEVAPEEVSDEDLEATQEEEEDEQDVELEDEAIQAPVSWSEEKKELFSKLPPEAQEYIHLRESQRDKGFQEKSTEVAELKKSFEAEKQAIEQERLKYADALAVQINQGLPEKPSVDLLNPNSPNYNPENYHLQKAQFEDAALHQQALMQQYEQTMQEQQNVQQEQFQKFVAEQNEILTNDLPEWSQDGFKDNILTYATDNGYNPEQLQHASAQDIKTLSKAMKYDTLMAKKPSVQDKVKVVPKVTKPGAKQGQSVKYEAKQARLKRLQTSGSLDDAAAVLRDLL